MTTVLDRHGKVQEFDFGKISTRLKGLLSEEEHKKVNVVEIVRKTAESIFPNISTQELDLTSANVCATFVSSNPLYGVLGGRILASNLKKCLEIEGLKTFSQRVQYISEHIKDYLKDDFVAYIHKNASKLDKMIVKSRDYDIDYFGFKTLERGYLIKVNEVIKETPQDLFMRVAINIHYRSNINKNEVLENIKNTYDLMSQKYFIHATPTLFNSGTVYEQCSSCFLLGTDDTIEGIFKTISHMAYISKWAGGIGVHVSNIRASGAKIKSTNGRSNGIVPMLKMYNETGRFINQGGKRNGSIAVYLEPWHGDTMEFLELKLNTGAEELRARDLFLAMWVPDYFMKQVECNGDWYLMSPDICPGLPDVYGEEFEKLYLKYVAEGKYIKKVEASKVWEKILISQIETGVPYIVFKDNVNRRSNQSNVGVVKSSNLCAEVLEVSTHDSYAVCNLASICVNRFLKEDGTYDWELLHKVARTATYNLNQVIDNNYYPTPETKENNLANRPIGIGIQGLADLLCRMKLPYESPEAIKMDADIMETIYHGAVEMSVELAEKYGSYPNFAGSPMNQGLLQFDLAGVTPRRYDWTELKEKVKKGMRNSLLTALMPTATTSQIQGHTECFEPVTSNIYTRKTLAGNFMIVNKYLIDELKGMNLWDLEMKNDIMDARGSVQGIERIPPEIREVYKTAWEIKQKAVIDHAIARAPYVDQSQSMNLFMATPTYDKITSALFYGWRNGIKTGCYYLRSLPAVAPQQFSQEVKKKNEKKEETMFCSLANPEACVMCSS
jgi:ribonucleoside-diphosphate reductase alpha chain